jgi:hypothetical protein
MFGGEGKLTNGQNGTICILTSKLKAWHMELDLVVLGNCVSSNWIILFQGAHMISTAEMARSYCTLPLTIHFSLWQRVSIFALLIHKCRSLMVELCGVLYVRAILNLTSYFGLLQSVQTDSSRNIHIYLIIFVHQKRFICDRYCILCRPTDTVFGSTAVNKIVQQFEWNRPAVLILNTFTSSAYVCYTFLFL